MLPSTRRSICSCSKDLEVFACDTGARLERRGQPEAERDFPIEEMFVSKKAYALALTVLLGATPVALAPQAAHSTTGSQNQELSQSDRMRARKMIGSRVY